MVLVYVFIHSENVYSAFVRDLSSVILFLSLLWPRRCHCTRQTLVYGCSPHSPVLRPACGLLQCQMQFTAVLSDHVDPSFLLPSPLSGSKYISVVCYFGG